MKYVKTGCWALVALFPLLGACATVDTLTPADQLAVDGQATHRVEGKVYEYAVATSIQAPAPVVWKLLTNTSDYPRWNSTVISIEGEIAQGQEINLLAKVSPDRAFHLTVRELEPNVRMVWADGMPMGMFAGVRTFTLTPQADGSTKLTMAEVFSGSMAKMITKSIPDLRPSFQDFAADLKREAEKQATSAP